MKKTLILAGILIILPFATFAHGGTFADADEQTATPEEQKVEKANHEQMQELMKKFMVQGTLSVEEADTMVTLMSEKMGGGMMGEQTNTMNAGTAGHHGNAGSGDMMSDGGEMGGSEMGGGMMGGGMFGMIAFHGFVVATNIVLLIAGGLYLFDRRRHTLVE